MSYFFMAVAMAVAVYFAIKYFKQKAGIGLLSESLAMRTSILTHTQEFRGTNENWSSLLAELNKLLSDIQRLGKENSDRLMQIETTLGSMREGVLIIDRDNYILLANKVLQGSFPALTENLGQRVESVLRGSHFMELVSEVKGSEVEEGRELVFSDGSRTMWMEVSASRLALVEESNAPWYLFVFHNITKLKELESMRQQFVANASHELKTPVSVIKGYAETLVEDHSTMEAEERDRFLRVIQSHSERLSLLINDLLSLSQLESGSLKLDWSSSDLLRWLREASFEIEQSLKTKGRDLILELPHDDEALVRFDVLKVRQVIDNLIENANKYSPPNTPIRLGASVENEDVNVWVIDEGQGVSDSDLTKIFERFYRVDKGRSRDTGGTGLGLSIVKRIVDCHDGRVWAENVEGKGLKLTFRLPLAARAIAGAND
jgi:two-component system, OmpR family, phosphate regulon sensor histidine kinase PhoR